MRAAACFMVGVAVFALTAAALVMIVVAALARGWSFWRHEAFIDAPMWAWVPGGAGALAAVALLVSFATAFVYFWTGACRSVLREIGAVPLDASRGQEKVVADVVEALSIGLGRRTPYLGVVDDPVPNALSMRSSRLRVLVVTAGLTTLPRHEIEAVCAHELGHLWARDAHSVTSGMVALARARRAGGALFALGIGMLVLVGLVLNYGDVFLWSTALVGVGLLVLGSFSGRTLRRLELAVRRSADEIADVAAVHLAKNPESLGEVCVRLAALQPVVRRVGWRSELLWFEAVESDIGIGDNMADARVDAALRSRNELLDRAVRAYAEARVPPPDVLRQAAR